MGAGALMHICISQQALRTPVTSAGFRRFDIVCGMSHRFSILANFDAGVRPGPKFCFVFVHAVIVFVAEFVLKTTASGGTTEESCQERGRGGSWYRSRAF